MEKKGGCYETANSTAPQLYVGGRRVDKNQKIKASGLTFGQVHLPLSRTFLVGQCACGGMVDTSVLKTAVLADMWVRLPPRAPILSLDIPFVKSFFLKRSSINYFLQTENNA